MSAPSQTPELPTSVAGHSFAPAPGSAVRAKDKSVRDLPVNCKLKAGQIIVEQRVCGIVFSFPSAVWSSDPAKQRSWVERLTPWWDMDAPDWSPQAHRLRESCVKSIANLYAPCSENREPLADRDLSLPNDGTHRREAAAGSRTKTLMSTQSAAPTTTVAEAPSRLPVALQPLVGRRVFHDLHSEKFRAWGTIAQATDKTVWIHWDNDDGGAQPHRIHCGFACHHVWVMPAKLPNAKLRHGGENK